MQDTWARIGPRTLCEARGAWRRGRPQPPTRRTRGHPESGSSAPARGSPCNGDGVGGLVLHVGGNSPGGSRWAGGSELWSIPGSSCPSRPHTDLCGLQGAARLFAPLKSIAASSSGHSLDDLEVNDRYLLPKTTAGAAGLLFMEATVRRFASFTCDFRHRGSDSVGTFLGRKELNPGARVLRVDTVQLQQIKPSTPRRRQQLARPPSSPASSLGF